MKVTFKGKEVKLIGIPPEVGDSMPNFTVLNKDKHKVTKDNLLGKVSLISVVPDINTPVCSIQTKGPKPSEQECEILELIIQLPYQMTNFHQTVIAYF